MFVYIVEQTERLSESKCSTHRVSQNLRRRVWFALGQDALILSFKTRPALLDKRNKFTTSLIVPMQFRMDDILHAWVIAKFEL